MTEVQRVAISKRLRFEVFKRDGFKCMYCGAHPPDVLLHADHIHPVALGGTTDMDNLITACQACNLGKSAQPLTDVPRSLEDRAAETSEREAQIAGYEAVMRERRNRIEAEAQEILEVFCERFARDSIPTKDFQSIKRFIERLGLNETVEAADIATTRWHTYRKSFLYFCGICWRKIRRAEGLE